MNLAARVLRDRPGARAALVCEDGSATWDELAARVARAAGGLRALGVRPGDRVLLVMRDSLEFAAAWLGTVHAGAVAVALNTKLDEADYRHVMADCGARIALVDPAFGVARTVFAHLCVSLPAAAAEAAAFDADPNAPAFCLYSSGTTGRPKGIVHAHRVAQSVGEAYRLLGIKAGESVLTTSKLFFAYGLEHGLLAPLSMGVTSVLAGEAADAQALALLAERHRPSAMFSVPTVYRRLLGEPPALHAALRGVRHFIAAGERLSPQLVERWRAALGAELLNLYGMSETFCACMMTPPGTSDGLRTGQPFPLTHVRLLDAQQREAPPGEPGVLWVRHPALARGYANLPEETRGQFRDGWFCSRDLFTRDAAGFYIHQGRADELLKVAGQWVWPAELEEAALGALSGSEAACVPVPDADGLERLALFVTGDEAAVRAALAACERLPRHKRPKWVRAVAELPRTATGKVQRYKLREILERELARSG